MSVIYNTLNKLKTLTENRDGKIIKIIGKNSAKPSLKSFLSPRMTVFLILTIAFGIGTMIGVDYLKLKVTALALPLIKKILDQREPRIDQINSLNLSTAARFITYIKSIEQTKKRGQSAILITPTVEQLAVLVKYFPPDWGNSVLIVSGDLYTNKNKYWNTWQKILTSQEPLVILGTRSAIFAPLPNLGLIIIDHAQSIDHKQYDQNPRYDARHVAEKISELTGCQLKLFCEGLYF